MQSLTPREAQVREFVRLEAAHEFDLARLRDRDVVDKDGNVTHMVGVRPGSYAAAVEATHTFDGIALEATGPAGRVPFGVVAGQGGATYEDYAAAQIARVAAATLDAALQFAMGAVNRGRP